ncbi:cytochrome P450 [Croceicoccus sp. BE223]|uniref:cytochrome P450 n=1 Tax=Croceicoccus sp. BE223 TaxID=2817716 RepID=UPI002866A562|nr:cytochrome P450 [Croceicoccus sp. BE223]MDR7101894.1 cytochrome P450 [Croceicoccus sp. BE223]
MASVTSDTLPGVSAPPHVDPARVVDVDIYAPEGQAEDYHRAWAAIQAANPELVWTPRNEGHWIALGGEALAEVQSSWEKFSNRVIVIPKSVGELHGLIPTTIDPPEHRPYRKLLNDSLRPSEVRGMRQSIRDVAVELIEGFRARGHCNFTEEFARIFPVRVFLAMVDVPQSDAETIRHWALCMTRPDMDMSFEEAKAAFYDYVSPLVTERSANPGDDMISKMLDAGLTLPDGSNRPLTHDEALALVTQLLIAGVDTVVNFMGYAFLELARRPDLRQSLRDNPGGTITATNELFRRFGIVTIGREVREDMVFRGVKLKAGEMIAMPTAVHGIDPAQNECPFSVDPSRRRAPHSTFGSGTHMCPGQELARAEVAITIEEWLARIPDFRVSADSDLTNDGGIVASIRRLCLEWDVEGPPA